VTGKLDLLQLATQPSCGRLYSLRDLNPLPSARWICVQVVPHLRDQLQPRLVGGGKCLT
jgi:hypothetical protein